MSQYNIFNAIFMSFYSRELYQDVGKNWGGKTFLYLLFILALSWVTKTIFIQHELTRMYASTSDTLVSQIPVMVIKQGKLSTPENRPYLIKEMDNEKIFAVIDTSGKFTDLSQTDSPLLITDTKIINRPSDKEVRIYELPAELSMAIDPLHINGYVKQGLRYSWIFIFIFLLSISYIYRITQAMIYSIIGKIFCAISGVNVGYGTILQVTMVALTPVILLATVMDFFMITFPHQNLTYFLIAMLYMVYGIIANKS